MAKQTNTAEKQLVVFTLSGQSYGVDIGTVREIIQIQAVTRVPGTPDSVEGVINLRGSVIPVIDLRSRFGLEKAEHSKDCRVVVVNSWGHDVGMTVDSVAEVMRISLESIEPPASVIAEGRAEYLLGIVKLKERLVILLDVDRILGNESHAADDLAKLIKSQNQTSGEAVLQAAA
jgi:purine-binding chemotaxis protein CheW